MNDNMSRMFCTKIKLLGIKTVLEVLLFQSFYYWRLPWNLEIHIFGKLSTLIQTELVQFLSSFVLFNLWDTHNSKNISIVHRSSYFYRMGKSFLATCFFSKIKVLLWHQLQVIRPYENLRYSTWSIYVHFGSKIMGSKH